jgi:hypothetical protein
MYTPDSWKIVKFESTEFGVVYKVLAGWYGGYAKGDSWKLNSGIVEVIETEDFYDFIGYSGYIYHCAKINEHVNRIMASIFDSWLALNAKSEDPAIIELVNYKDYINAISN